MKKLFISIPFIAVVAFSSCEKEPETITETVTVTDTLTVTQNNSVGLYLEKFEQIYIGAGFGYGAATQNYSVTNLGEKKISVLEVKFEAKTSDNSTYTANDFIFDLGVGETTSSQGYISTADKECSAVKIKEIEITSE